MVSFLVPELPSVLAEDEERLLAQDHDVMVLQVDIEVKTNLPGLLANVGHPGRLYRCLLVVVLRLDLFLLLQVIVCVCLH